MSGSKPPVATPALAGPSLGLELLEAPEDVLCFARAGEDGDVCVVAVNFSATPVHVSQLAGREIVFSSVSGHECPSDGTLFADEAVVARGLHVSDRAAREPLSMGMKPPDGADVAPDHDPFDAPDTEDEADTRERVLEGGEDAGDGDAPRVRRELGLEDDDRPGPSTD